MGHRLKTTFALVVAVLVVVATAAYAWDRSKADQVAEGIHVGGVDVGGLSGTEAERRLERRVADPLSEPLTVEFEGTRYVLPADRLETRLDVEGMVDDALDASRDGSLPERVWRYATGDEVDREIAPRLSYSGAALDSFVAEVAGEINRPARDATVEASPASLDTVPAQDGLELRADELRADLESAIQSRRDRTVTAEAERVEPEVTTDELAARYPVYLTVDRSSFQLRLWRELELAKTYTIAVGAVGFDTPAGTYHIQNKAVDPAWNVPESDWAGDLAGKVIPGGAPDNPLKARWLGIYDGAGIHGTDDVGSLGSAASHGCIRMAVPDVVEVYDQVPVGTPIYIG